MRVSIKSVVVKTNNDYTSLRYNKPNDMPNYFYVEPLDVKPGDIVTIIVEQQENMEE